MKRKTALFISVGIFILAVVLFAVLRLNGFGRGTGNIAFPKSPSQTADSDEIEQTNLRVLEDIEINPLNVKGVISTLSRPAEYDLTAQTVYFNDNDSAAFTSRVRAKNGLFRITVYKENGNVLKNVILTPSDVYIWGSESRTYFQGKRGDISEDDEARLPTYEDVLKTDDEEITDAGVTELDGVMCVYLSAGKKDTDVSQKFFVSVLNGLLYSFEETAQGKTVLSAKVISVDTSPVSDNWFILPSGALAE